MKYPTLLLSIATLSGSVGANVCTKGQPCGQSCISWADVCHIGTYVPPVTTIATTTTTTTTTLAPRDTTSPTVPAGAIASAVNASQINLSWTASIDNVGVTTYKINRIVYNTCVSSPETSCAAWYAMTILVATLSGAPPVTSFSDTGLAPSTRYDYTVQACDAAGNCSAESAAVTATTPPLATQSFKLSVTNSGTGYGNVASTPSGISCYVPVPGVYYFVAPDCSESYSSGTNVTLSATPTSDSTFDGWSGACAGTSSTCTIGMTAAQTVQANFTSLNTTAKSDCLFNWAESNYDFLFAPKGMGSKTFGTYYLRYYTQTTAYLAVSSSSLVYLGPLSSNQIMDLGPVSKWYRDAGCN